ncbi:cytochrome P450 (plasmid) [Streptomyces sp. NBC_01544]|uniref:hypothetical protein n=1 Tax=Streptomyces sp. NBC_01544 TaxID=2975871 RepID=UPI00386EBEAC
MARALRPSRSVDMEFGAMTSHAAQAAVPSRPLPSGCPLHHSPLSFGTADMTGEDPEALFTRLRERGPVIDIRLEGDVPAWLVIGYNEADEVLRRTDRYTRDPRTWNVPREGRLPEGWPLEPHLTFRPDMLFASGAEHARLRGSLNRSLGAIGSYRLHRSIKDAADRLIDAFQEAGEAELVSQYAAPLPMFVLTRLFGFPRQDEALLQSGIRTLLEAGEDALDANRMINQIIAAHIARRRAEPATDIVSALVQDSAALTDAEIHATIWLTINAALGATTSWLSNTIGSLARSAARQHDLHSGYADVQSVMDETLWGLTPVQQIIGYIATGDRELGGARVRDGDLLVVSLAGANLDHQRLGGDRHRASYTDRDGANLSWGNGPHDCPAPARALASAIVRDGVDRLWTRLPDLHLTDPDEPTTWGPSPIVRTPDELLGSFDAGKAHALAQTLTTGGR